MDWSYAQIIFPNWPGGINKEPTVWLDEARPTLSTFSKIKWVWRTKKVDLLRPYDFKCRIKSLSMIVASSLAGKSSAGEDKRPSLNLNKHTQNLYQSLVHFDFYYSGTCIAPSLTMLWYCRPPRVYNGPFTGYRDCLPANKVAFMKTHKCASTSIQVSMLQQICRRHFRRYLHIFLWF